MTPELKKACELVFQEHKTTVDPINWSRNVFQGRISFGLSEMAKETLLEKNIIYIPKLSKKTITALNPSAVAATNFEEAEEIVQNKIPSFSADKNAKELLYTTTRAKKNPNYNNYILLRVTNNSKPAATIIKSKWYTRPLFYYTIWLTVAAVAGAFIAWFLGVVYTEFFLAS